MSSLSSSLLRNHIAAVRHKNPHAGIIGLRTRSAWEGSECVSVGDEEFLVRSCASELAMREAVLDAEARQCPLVILSAVPDAELSRDLLVRFAKRKFLRLDVWDSLRNLFQASNSLDARIRPYTWLVERMLERVPPDGYRPAPNGVLTLDHLWAEFFRVCLGIRSARPDARELLRWGNEADGVQEYQALEASCQRDIKDWTRQSAGDLGPFILTFIEKGKGSLLVTAGLACEVLYAEEAKGISACRDGAIRLEKYNGGQPLNRPLGIQFSQAAMEYLNARGSSAGKDLEVALDRLLEDLGVLDLAWLSSYSSEGFEQRLGRFADELKKGLNSKGSFNASTLWKLADHAQGHKLSASNSERIQRLSMACRLRQWMENTESEPQDFPEAVARYYREGGFVDRARYELLGGEGNEDLAKAFSALFQKLDAARERGAEAFASKLSAWMESGSTPKGFLRIEEVLAEVCAPLAKTQRVLVVVLDGMSMAVYRQLQEDLIQRYRWVEYAREGESGALPCLAAVPSVTEVSRCSLLCGRLTHRGQDDEKKGFRDHKALKEVSGSSAPVLFLKKDLVASGGVELSQELMDEMKSPKRKIVGAVVNAVDDHLLKGDQIHFTWRISSIPVLEKLLFAAKETERAVVLTSDHGHVFDRSSTYQDAEPGERYRTDSREPGDGELIVKGPRVMVEGHQLIAPWVETLRYGPKKNGYHGGVSPQEMVIPCAVFAPEWKINGWEPVGSLPPEWWQPFGAARELPQPAAVPKPAETKPEEDDLPLFKAAGAGAALPNTAENWIEELLGSDILKAQRQLAGRARLTDDQLVKILSAITQQGDTILVGTLAQRIQQPPFRIPGMISYLQRLLNVEGYNVLGHDPASETVTLHLDLLKSQFELSS